MKRWVLDASAVLRWIEDGPGATRVEELIFQAGSGGTQVSVSAVNWGEVYYVIAHKQGEDRAAFFSARFRDLPIEIVPADYSRAERAGIFRNKFSVAYADAFAASLAASERATLMTSDYDFKRVADGVSVEFLPPARKR
jgi:predicted nucleic acid-binding protein